MERKEAGKRRWRFVALLAIGIALGTALAAPPVYSHVGGTVAHLWTQHIRPRADARYLRSNGLLPHGKTLRGAFNMGGTASAATDLANTSISFGLALRSAPTAHFIRQGDSAPSACPGNATFPQARPGHLCIYEESRLNTAGGLINGVVRSGATIYIFATAGGSNFFSFGTWAVREQR